MGTNLLKIAGTCIAIGALASLGLATSATAQEKVRIGVVLPLSGQFALGGQNVKRGYDLAAEDINKNGGVKSLGGAPIELVYADNQGKQEVAIGETERLIQDEKVAAIMGSWHSATTIAGTQAAERLKTPWLIEVSSANIILERGFKYVARVNVKASWYGEAPVDFLDYAKSSLHQDVKRVAIMYVDDDWGRASVGKGTKEALQKHGYEIVADLAYPSASQDVTSYINQIKAAKPDAVIVTSFPERCTPGRTHNGTAWREGADRRRRLIGLRAAHLPEHARTGG